MVESALRGAAHARAVCTEDAVVAGAEELAPLAAPINLAALVRADGRDDALVLSGQDEDRVAAQSRTPARAVLDKDLAPQRLRARHLAHLRDREPVARVAAAHADLARARSQEFEGSRDERAGDGGEDRGGNPEDDSPAQVRRDAAHVGRFIGRAGRSCFRLLFHRQKCTRTGRAAVCNLPPSEAQYVSPQRRSFYPIQTLAA